MKKRKIGVTNCLDCDKNISRGSNYCKKCGYKHRIRPKGLTYKIIAINKGWFKKGTVSSLKGIELGEKSKVWKGNKVGYWGIHSWIERRKGLAREGICEKCGDNKNIQWSNKSNFYLRDISDWQRLCKKCHMHYDYENFGARREFYEKA